MKGRSDSAASQLAKDTGEAVGKLIGAKRLLAVLNTGAKGGPSLVRHVCDV